MAFDEHLAGRIRAHLSSRSDVVEKKMFGGICFMVSGNMACGVHKDSLIVRMGPDQAAARLERPGARVFDLTGRAMKGWLTVEPAGLTSDATLHEWLELGTAHAASLPPK
ncbi:MAG: TfoX/Sxy family protein [Chloroflexota bacterium]